MGWKNIILKKENKIGFITLNRPEVHNALNAALLSELGEVVELAMACTLRIASENARLGLPELGLGLIPGYGGTQRLTRLVGRGKAFEMILTAKPIDAVEAFRIGLVNQVVPLAELIPKAKEMAESILKSGPTAIRLAMDLLLRGQEMSLDNSTAFESAMTAVSLMSPEATQRLKAFLEKKK
jgi:enoyl-CoA hydratase/carnithine racemase